MNGSEIEMRRWTAKRTTAVVLDVREPHDRGPEKAYSTSGEKGQGSRAETGSACSTGTKPRAVEASAAGMGRA